MTGGLLWLASYPKSGNTWLRLALAALIEPAPAAGVLRHRPEMAASRQRLDALLCVETANLGEEQVESARPWAHARWAREVPRLTPVKVHDAWTRTSSGAPLFAPGTGPAIYVARDPRDVAISFSHHFDCTIDDAIARMGDGAFRLAEPEGGVKTQVPQRLLSWSAHAASWIDAPGMRVHLVRYEDMLTDTPGALEEVARFAGLDVDRRAVERAAEATSFARLHQEERTHGFDERTGRDAPFFRRGMAGEWREVLSANQRARIERDHAGMMRRLGYLA